jgi:hypothetical protein
MNWEAAGSNPAVGVDVKMRQSEGPWRRYPRLQIVGLTQGVVVANYYSRLATCEQNIQGKGPTSNPVLKYRTRGCTFLIDSFRFSPHHKGYELSLARIP